MPVTAVGFEGTVDEAQWARYTMRATEIAYRHGVWSGGEVTPGTGRAVNVAVIDAIVPGVWFVSDSVTSIPIAANGTSNPRIDYIVAEANWAANTVSLTAVIGTAAARPVPPALNQTAGSVWQMPLARVTVAAGAASFTAETIEHCAPLRRRTYTYKSAVAADAIRGSATSWNTISAIDVTDPGWPYRLQVSACARINATEGGGYMRLRISDATSNTNYAEGVTPWLQIEGYRAGGKSPADITAQVSGQLTGARRVRLEMLPVEAAAGEQLQVLDHPSNHFTVLLIPA